MISSKTIIFASIAAVMFAITRSREGTTENPGIEVISGVFFLVSAIGAATSLFYDAGGPRKVVSFVGSLFNVWALVFVAWFLYMIFIR
jgi:hypothetical protein